MNKKKANEVVVSLPKFDLPEDNFTRRLRVMVKADLALDIKLDEEEYEYMFLVEDGQEFRVEVAHAGENDIKADVFTVTPDLQKEINKEGYYKVSVNPEPGPKPEPEPELEPESKKED